MNCLYSGTTVNDRIWEVKRGVKDESKQGFWPGQPGGWRCY